MDCNSTSYEKEELWICCLNKILVLQHHCRFRIQKSKHQYAEYLHSINKYHTCHLCALLLTIEHIRAPLSRDVISPSLWSIQPCTRAWWYLERLLFTQNASWKKRRVSNFLTGHMQWGWASNLDEMHALKVQKWSLYKHVPFYSQFLHKVLIRHGNHISSKFVVKSLVNKASNTFFNHLKVPGNYC